MGASGALPRQVIAEDHRLEGAEARSSVALGKLRWHWTANEKNPQRVEYTDYARGVGRVAGTIRRYAVAYPLYEAAKGKRTFVDCLEQAGTSTEKFAVTKAIADARGITIQRVRDTRLEEVKQVRHIAREQAEQKGTTVEQEAPRVAAMVVRHEVAVKKEKERRNVGRTGAYIEASGYLERAQDFLKKALAVAHAVKWERGSEEHELMQADVTKARRLVDLVEMALRNEKVDWDKELAQLVGAK